ncbi:MAG: glycosyltransferase [Actinomycetota bacterium]
MDLLYITNGFPFPLTSGYLRHYHLLRELAPRHRVTLLSMVGPGFEPAHREALAPFVDAIHTFGAGPGGTRLAKVRRRLEGVVRSPSSGPVAAMRAVAESLVARQHFDAVVFSGKRTYPVLDALRSLPVVADMCDATSSRLRGGLTFAAPVQRARDLAELLEVRRVERHLLDLADHLVFASARDRDLLARGPALERSTVVPNGVDLEFWERSEPTLGRSRVVFTGKMDYPPNEHAALHLAHAVMPIVRQSVPDAELLIVGRDPTARLLAAAGPGVTVTGYVDDVRPYLDSASVFAAPLHFGAGIQNKVLDALAMGVPVVASSLAAAGVRAGDGSAAPIAVADGPMAFAGLVVERLRAAAAGASPSAESRRFVADSFAWADSARLLEDAVGAAVSARSLRSAT